MIGCQLLLCFYLGEAGFGVYLFCFFEYYEVSYEIEEGGRIEHATDHGLYLRGKAGGLFFAIGGLPCHVAGDACGYAACFALMTI